MDRFSPSSLDRIMVHLEDTRGRMTKIQATSRPENRMPEVWPDASKKSQQEEILYRSGRQGNSMKPSKMSERSWKCTGLCNAMQIAKHLCEFILKGRLTTRQEKIREKQWQGEISLAHTTTRKTAKLLTHAYARRTNLPESAFQKLKNKDDEDHIVEKVVQFFESLKISCANLFLCLRQ